MKDGTSEAAAFLRRVDAVEVRLRALAETPVEQAAGHLTAADAGTGEQWEWGQVWAHLAEFVPYWIAQARTVIAESGGVPVPFGRTQADSGRIAAIEGNRHSAVTVLWATLNAHIGQLRAFLTELPDSAWSWHVRGAHPTLGTMSLAQIVDEFMVGHLEQHADQLDSLLRA